MAGDTLNCFNCPAGAACIAGDGSPNQCVCNPGFVGNGTVCVPDRCGPPINGSIAEEWRVDAHYVPNPLSDAIGTGRWVEARRYSTFFDSSANGAGLLWSQAEQACRNVTPFWHLASFHSLTQGQEAAAVVSSQDSPPVFIGLTYNTSKGNWSWTDGSSVDYLAWGDGQPDNPTGSETVVQAKVWMPTTTNGNGPLLFW